MQTTARNDFGDKIDSDFTKIVLTFTGFMSFLLVMFILSWQKLIEKIKIRLLRIKFLLKLIPSKEIIELKN